MRIPLRSLGILALAIVGATCSDAPSRPARFETKGRLAISPVFSNDAAAVFARRSQFDAVTYDHVRLVLQRGSGAARGEKVGDTTLVFTPGSGSIQLDLTVDVEKIGDPFDATVEFTNNGVPVFRGTQSVESYAPGTPTPPSGEVVVNYVGPGSTAKSVAISPKSTTLQHPGSTTLSATVLDQNGGAMGNVPLSWISSNPNIATINASTGTVSTVARGTTTITVSTPTGLTDNSTVAVTLPPTKLDLRSGGGQTARVGQPVGPVTVRAVASDNIGVPGVAVSFTPPPGGSVLPSNPTTDANGDVIVTLTLGSAVGTQTFVAAAVTPSGTPITLNITETATAGTASAIQALSGGNQLDTIRLALKQPLVARVVDQFGNGVPGVSVSWGRTGGTGSLSAASSTTNSNGEASINYTLGATPGPEQITASVSGITSSAIFNATAVPAGPADVTIVTGNNQTGKALLPLDKPFVGVVVDRAGATVAGVTVTWVATNGSFASPTTVSDAQGQVRNTLTLAGKLGPASATASIPNGKTMTFAATVRPGIPTHMVYRTQPTNAVAGVAIAPPIQVELRDGAENVATDDNGNITLALSSNPGASALRGTATQMSDNGVATFGNISLDKIGNGYALVAVSGTLPQLTSATFNISPAAAASIAIVDGAGQTATVNTAVAAAPSVRVADAFNNPVPNQLVHFAPATGSGTATPADVSTNAQGIATLTSWVLGTAIGPKTMAVSIPAAPSVAGVSFTATAIAGQATKLAITTQPSVTAAAGSPLAVAPVIQLQDTFGNPTAVGAPTTITATPSAGAASNNTATAAAGTGTATFNGLSLTLVGNITLAFSAPGLQGITSNAIAVTPGPVSVLRLVAGDNQNGTVGVPVAIAPSVRAADAFDNSTPGVTVAFSTTTPGSTVSSPTVTTNAQGVATLGSWTLGTAMSPPAHTLTAAVQGSSGIGPVQFQATAAPGPATKLAIVTQPSPTVVAGVALAQQPVIQIQDKFGNPVGAGAVVITATASGVVTGNSVVANATTGLASFTSLTLRQAGNLTVTFSASGLTPVTSNQVAVSPAGVSSLVVVSGNNQSDTVRAVLQNDPGVLALDAFGNAVPNAAVTFVASGNGIVVPATPIQTNALGVATVTSWTLGTAAGLQTLTASSSGASVGISALSRAASAFRLVFNQNPPATVLQGDPLGGIVVGVQDQFGNARTVATDVITIQVAGAVLTGNPVVQASGGSAFFGQLAIDRPGTYRLSASSPTVSGGAIALSSPVTVTGGTLEGAITDPADQITATTARLLARVAETGSAYDIWFEFGSSPTLAGYAETGRSAGPCGQGCFWFITLNFSPGSTNYFRVAVRNANGTARGAILSFTTPTTSPATSDGLGRGLSTPCVNGGVTPVSPSGKPVPMAGSIGSGGSRSTPCLSVAPSLNRRP